MKYILLVNAVVLFFLGSGISYADDTGKRRSLRADLNSELNESEPSTLYSAKPFKKSDFLVGFRAGQAGAFGGELSLGGNIEYVYNPEFSFGGQIYRASHSKEITANELKVRVDYRTIAIAFLGNWHPPFIRSVFFDPFVSVGLAHSFVKAEISLPGGSPFPNSTNSSMQIENDDTYLVGSLNARYFLDKNLSAIASLGFGLSRFTIGMDYLF